MEAPPLGTERESFGAAKGAGDAAEAADSNVARRRQEKRMGSQYGNGGKIARCAVKRFHEQRK